MAIRVGQTPVIHQTNKQLAKAHKVARQIVSGKIPATPEMQLFSRFLMERIRAEYFRRLNLIEQEK